jgi:hypothetical protein
MNVILGGLVPAATYKAFLAAKAQVYVDMLMQVPGAAYASGAADANGYLTLDLPLRQEFLIQGPNGYAKRVLNATTVGGAP